MITYPNDPEKKNEMAVLQAAIASTLAQRKTDLLAEPAIFTEEYKASEEKNQQWKAFKRSCRRTKRRRPWSMNAMNGS